MVHKRREGRIIVAHASVTLGLLAVGLAVGSTGAIILIGVLFLVHGVIVTLGLVNRIHGYENLVTLYWVATVQTFFLLLLANKVTAGDFRGLVALGTVVLIGAAVSLWRVLESGGDSAG